MHLIIDCWNGNVYVFWSTSSQIYDGFHKNTGKQAISSIGSETEQGQRVTKNLSSTYSGESDKRQLQALLENVLSEAKTQGATGAEASINIGTGLNVNVRMNDVETIEYNRDKGLGVVVYFDNRKGAASTTDFSDEAVRNTVISACSIAKHTQEDPFAGLADASLMATTYPDLDLYHPWDLVPAEAIEIGKQCEAAAFSKDARIINSEGATVNSHQSYRLYGNSNGFIGGYSSTSHHVSCVVLAGESDEMERDYWYSIARDHNELDSVVSIGEKAAERAVSRLAARSIPTCRVPIVFSADVASSLIRHFLSAIQGRNLYRQSSFLLDKLGEQVFPDFINIHENPHLPRAMGSAPFDKEGVLTRNNVMVRNGVLKGYVLDSYAARKLGMQTTANAGGVHNLIIDPVNEGLESLLDQMGSGLLITELMGQGVNIVTGDYSRGAAGYWIENGNIQYPVHEITVAGNLAEIFMKIQGVGSDIDSRGNIRSGSILVESMTVAGK
jgi:PmbA protein